MNPIATDVEDSLSRMQENVAALRKTPGAALTGYFYRSHVTYQQELNNIVFKSWLWAGHVSQVPNIGDYFLYELAEESVIVVRHDDGSIRALINSCRHR